MQLSVLFSNQSRCNSNTQRPRWIKTKWSWTYSVPMGSVSLKMRCGLVESWHKEWVGLGSAVWVWVGHLRMIHERRRRLWLLMEMESWVSTSRPMTFVFFMLMVRPNSLQADDSLSISTWNPDSVWDASAASSAKSISLRRTRVTLVLARKRSRLKGLPSALVCR